jgi:hypothetical protein
MFQQTGFGSLLKEVRMRSNESLVEVMKEVIRYLQWTIIGLKTLLWPRRGYDEKHRRM